LVLELSQAITSNLLGEYESVTFTNSFDVSKPEQATFTFSDFASVVSGLGQDITIYRGNYPIWRGLGTKTDAKLNKSSLKQYVLNCLSNKVYLDREPFSRVLGPNLTYDLLYGGGFQSSSNLFASGSIPSTFATDIFRDILNAQTPPRGLAPGAINSPSSAPVPHVCGIQVTRIKILALLQQLIAGSLWEARFNPDNTVDFQPSPSPGSGFGNSKPTFTITEGLNTERFEYSLDISKMCNLAIVCGGGTGISQIVRTANNAASIKAMGGVWSTIKNLPNVTDPNLLQAYANALVNDLSYPIPTISADIVDYDPGVNFREGDAVIVNSPTFQFKNQIFRIIDITRTFDSSSYEKITVTLAQSVRQSNILQFLLDQVDIQAHNFHSQHKLLANSLAPGAQPAASFNILSGWYAVSPTDINGQGGYVSPALTGTGSATVHYYMSLSVSGLFASWNAFFTVWSNSGVGTASNLGINDLSDSSKPVLYVPGNITFGNPYSAGAWQTNDISDHVLDFFVTYTWTSGSFALLLQPYLYFTPTTIPN
jgi:hypothetical protein